MHANPYQSSIPVEDVDASRPASESQSESDAASDGNEIGPRKRKRPLNVTCEACKQRKVRCDRARPACGWCSRNDHACEYKERKKPGLRAGYGRELENRLDRLEAVIADQGNQLAAHLRQACSLQSPSTGGFATGEASLKQPVIDPQLRPDFTRQHSLQYTPAHTTQQVTIDPIVQTYQTPSAHSQALTSPSIHTAPIPTGPGYNESSGITILPPYDLLYALVDAYFRHVNSWIPLLDKKTTLDTLFGASPLEEADRVLLHAIVAVSVRFSQDSRLTFESRKLYHSTSKQKVQLFGLENSSVRALQALVILALDVTGTTNGPPGWNLMALISRSVIQLGLSVETTSSLTSPMYPSIATLRAAVLPEPKSPIEDEGRRRLFWAVYYLDRYVTVATAFEFALDEKEVDRRLPCRDDIFAANKTADTKWFRQSDRSRFASGLQDVHGHFSYHCELLGILGRIHLFLKRPIDIGSLPDVEQWQGSYRALDSELNAWHFSLPDDFSSITRLMKMKTPAKPASCGWVMLHAAYCLTMIRLNSSAAYPSQTSPIFSSSYSAMQRCLSAVESMRQLSQFVKMSLLLDKVGPAFAFAAWVSARVMLVHGSTMDHEVDPDIGFFVTLLAEMGHYWEVAKRYSDILSRVLDEYRASQRTSRSGERITPSTVKILADMRRCAYDLDFLISRQPHNATKSYHPTRANTPAPNELEYLDVFDLFNFPRMPIPADGMQNVQSGGLDTPHATMMSSVDATMGIPNFAQPNPDSDWLFHNT